MKVDREGGSPLGMTVEKLDINGFHGKQDWGCSYFVAPCIYHAFIDVDQQNGSETQKVRRSSHYIAIYSDWISRSN